jgi:4-hydroxy-tetrahydrodipicolinate reductase
VFDVLPLTLASAAWDVRRITVRRVLDAVAFGQAVHRRLGLGFTEEEFHANVRAGEIWGHIGFPESAAMLCRCMGRTLDHVEQVLTPVPATKDYQLRDWRISTGTSAGVMHRAVGWVAQEPWLEFEVALHVAPADLGWSVKDEIVIDGRHRVSVTIDPSCGAVLTTAARLVNSIPRVLNAPPGLYAPVDLPPSGPWFAAEGSGS